MLPTPASKRWRPLRSGLVNLFKYENEVFQFEDGRLLLRGNNGAGKSRVLALQLPFLLDGEISPHRVEPDGDPAKRMEWNLLMGDRHDNRLGYTWIEFGRIDDDGTEHHVTLACGLHARRHGKLNRWYLITPLRIGADLHLVSEQNVPLTKDRLAAEIDGRGDIYDGPREYRTAVDGALFKLGSRYEPLIELLIRLRQPQLSRKLERDVLSDALSDALPPLSPSLIEDVSAAFRGIEDDREAMNDYRAARADVAAFLATYRTYAAIVVRRYAEAVRTENSRYEQSARDKKKYSEEHERLQQLLAGLTTGLQRAKNELSSQQAAAKTLRDSPEMKSVETLEQAQKHCAELKRHLEQAAANEKHEAENHRRCERERNEAEEKFVQRRDAAEQTEESFREAGGRAGLPLAEELNRSSFDKSSGPRNEAVLHLRRLNQDLQQAEQRHSAAEANLTRTRGDLESARETGALAENRLADSVNDFTQGTLAWETSTTELKLDAAIDWRETTLDWLAERDSPFPFELAVRTAHAQRQSELITERESVSEQRRQRLQDLESLQAELDALLDGRQPEPPLPHTRAVDSRQDRPGAPLWKLCDFREEVSAADRAGYEAALESAGILDAWITPDAELVDARTGDVFLTGTDGLPDGGLNRILAATSDAVPTEAVQRILGRIGSEIDAGQTWVAADGYWANGPLRGDWTKSEAEFLGFDAREKARLRELARREGNIKELNAELTALERSFAELKLRLESLERERASAPGSDVIREAAVSLDAAREAVLQAQERVSEAEQAIAAELKHLEACREKRNQDATDLGLSRWREPAALNELETFMSRLRERATEFWGARQAASDAESALQAAATRLADIASRLEELRQLGAKAENRFAAADGELKTLQATLGKTAEEVMARLREAQGAIEQADRLVDQLQADHAETGGDLRVKERDIQNAEKERAERQQSRDEAVTKLHQLVANGFVGEAHDELQPDSAGWSVARAVELSRRAEQMLKVTHAADEALAKAQTSLQEQLTRLHDQLGMHGYQPRAEAIQDGVWIVKCPFQGQDRTMSALHLLLGDEVTHRSRMLDESEREVIENHLIGEVAKELQERIRAGEKWVADVNAELEQRPTSSGIKLRFVWRVDPEGPPGLAEANQQLLRMAAVWSPEERKAIGDFLQNRIRAERSDNEEGSWQDHLSRALDYRTWRRFDIERWQNGKWQRLTRKTYGTGSGGEKAVTLTVPQFAAAAAHYRSADRLAPRLILLDEVFVGIDGETRAELMGLLDTFDLDYVMTSEREWGCYATVPSLAIYQLASRPELNAVHVTRWVWNGREKVRDG